MYYQIISPLIGNCTQQKHHCAVTNELLGWMDEGKCGVLLLLDLSAAFDIVVHEILLEDLRAIGVTQRALYYLENYLNRNYCVQVGNTFSEHGTLRKGVPQGSVLEPVLFCIYSIELSFLLREHGVAFNLFADVFSFICLSVMCWTLKLC